MAKRKRLTPANPDHLAAAHPAGLSRTMTAAAPIAQVAGQAATQAALNELSQTLTEARGQGRLIERLPLDSIDPDHLVRDRLVQDETEMQALMDSLRTRGQQTPIEVVELPNAKSGTPRYGLISGWRRWTALGRLARDDGGLGMDQILARIVTPDSAQDAYVAMIEENEIRANLSFYERARITMQAVHAGIYPTTRAALQGLFGAAPRARRSKIGSFTTLVEELHQDLRFPTAISEKLGLSLVKALQENHRFKQQLVLRLRQAEITSAEQENAILTASLAGWRRKESNTPEAEPATKVVPQPQAMGLDGPDAIRRRRAVKSRFDAENNRIELTGAGVDLEFLRSLENWLKAR